MEQEVAECVVGEDASVRYDCCVEEQDKGVEVSRVISIRSWSVERYS